MASLQNLRDPSNEASRFLSLYLSYFFIENIWTKTKSLPFSNGVVSVDRDVSKPDYHIKFVLEHLWTIQTYFYRVTRADLDISGYTVYSGTCL